MNLRLKTLLITVLTLAGLIVILYAAARFILLRSYVELEARHVRQNVESAHNAFLDDLLELKQKTLDNAEWDETYAFMGGDTPDYIATNFPDETFGLMRINLLIFIDASGAIVYERVLDLANMQEIGLTRALQSQLHKNSLPIRVPLSGKQVAGVLLLPEGPLMIAANPVLTTDSEGPVAGVMLMARYLDNAQIQRLATITRLTLSLHPLDDSISPSPKAPNKFPVGYDTVVIRPLSADSIAGYAVLKDLRGQPALALRVLMPRSIYQQGRASISYFVAALLVSGVVFGLVILLLLEKMVISRFANLGAQVSRIGASGDHSLRISVAGNDELSRLSDEINQMLDSLQRSQEGLRNLSAHLQDLREEERTSIAREIHDELGQVLSTLKMDLHALESQFPKEQTGWMEITRSMAELISLTLERIKKISQELRPSVMDHLAFPQAVAWQVEQFMAKTGISCQLNSHNVDHLRLTRDASDALFRVLQEALTNIYRHAHATQVNVHLETNCESLVLRVQDNGRGITSWALDDPQSFGLIGMRERIHHLHGSIEIQTRMNHGTNIICRMPLAQ